MAAAAILNLVSMGFWHDIAFYVRLAKFPLNLVRIESRNGSTYSKSKMAAAAILKNTLPVELPVWEWNSWCVNSNQKSNLCGVILTFKGRLLSRALMLKRFPLQIGQVRKRVEVLVFCWAGDPPNSEFQGSKPRKGTCTKQDTSFELSNVRIGSELRPVGEMRKRKKGRTKVTKPWYFTTVWRCPL